ncbi:predicted protein, partial [Nematostella vectensis]
WSWLVCLSAALSNTIVVGLSFSYGVLFPVLLDYFKEDKATTGISWVGSLFMSVSFFVAPISASLCDQYGCRITAMGGAFICCLGLLLTSQAPSLYTMFLTYSTITGFGCCCVYTACFIAVPKYFTQSRSLAVGFVCLGPAAGVMVIAPLLQLLLDLVGWRRALLCLAGVTAVVCLVTSSFDSEIVKRPESPARSLGLDEGTKAERGPYGIMLRDTRFLLLLVVSALVFLALYNPQMHLVKFCQTLGITDDKSSMLFLYIGLASSVLRIISGRLCDSPHINPLIILQGGYTLLGCMYILLPWATMYSQLVGIAIAIGTMDGLACTAINLLILESLEEKYRGHAYGVWLTVVSIPIAVGPPLTGLISDRFGTYTPGFSMSGTLLVLSALVSCSINLIRREPVQTEVTITTMESRRLITEKLTVV